MYVFSFNRYVKVLQVFVCSAGKEKSATTTLVQLGIRLKKPLKETLTHRYPSVRFLGGIPALNCFMQRTQALLAIAITYFF